MDCILNLPNAKASHNPQTMARSDDEEQCQGENQGKGLNHEFFGRCQVLFSVPNIELSL